MIRRSLTHAALCSVWTLSSPRTFLLSLHPSEVKSAYRKKAKETHPDRSFFADPVFQKKQTERFRAILESYETLERFFKKRSEERGKAFHRPAASVRSRPAHRTPGYQASAHQPRSFDGPVPNFTMELGRYLFHRRAISYPSLIQALAWQRRQRPVIGDIARRWGWLDQDRSRQIADYRGQPFPFGERCVHLGFLSPFQVRLLLAYQRTQQQRLGRYFLELGVLAHEEMEQLVADLKEHNARIRLHRARVEAGITFGIQARW